MQYIDLRSDTVTRPTEAMRRAMYEAEVGDDVFREDPTVNKLQEYAAELLGKEDALFVMSGVMGNQICLNLHTRSGDEIICEEHAHIVHYESGSPAWLSGVQLNWVKGTRGVFTPEQALEALRPVEAYYMPRSRILEVENTHNRAGGAVHPIENIRELRKFADEYKLAFHLDGARIWNAEAATGITVKEYAEPFDTVSCCLSKGLGAPIGSIIAGPKEFIREAFRLRKAMGGGTRQVGVIAAAGLYALQNNRERLAEDHKRAQKLAEFINDHPALEIDIEGVHTNILIFKTLKMNADEAMKQCKEKGLLFSVGTPGTLRAVTHLDVDDKALEKALQIMKEVF